MNINIYYNEVADFFLALFRATNEEAFNKFDFTRRFKLSKDIQEFVADTKKRMSPILKRDIDYLLGNMARGVVSILYDALNRGIKDMDEFFKYYKNISTDEFLDLIYNSLNIDGLRDMSRDEQRKAIDTLLKEELYSECIEKADIYMDYLMYPDDIKMRLFNTFESFYNTFVRPRKEKVRTIMHKKLEEHKKLASDDPNTFLEKTIIVLSKEDFANRDITMYVNYYGEVDCSVDVEDDSLVVIYGYALEQLFDEDMLKNEYKNLLKTLSDDKRYEIVELLGKRAWYGKELADHLGITTATLSYHIKKIMMLGIVLVEPGEHKRIYYNLNKEKFKEIMNSMVSELISE